MIIKPHFVTDSGCVEDQPQRMDFSERHRFIRVLRLVSDTAALRDPALFPVTPRNFCLVPTGQPEISQTRSVWFASQK